MKEKGETEICSNYYNCSGGLVERKFERIYVEVEGRTETGDCNWKLREAVRRSESVNMLTSELVFEFSIIQFW